jgi:hypothetical protein
MGAHICNPSYWGVQGRRITIWKKKEKKRKKPKREKTEGMAQDSNPRTKIIFFKIQGRQLEVTSLSPDPTLVGSGFWSKPLRPHPVLSLECYLPYLPEELILSFKAVLFMTLSLVFLFCFVWNWLCYLLSSYNTLLFTYLRNHHENRVWDGFPEVQDTVSWPLLSVFYSTSHCWHSLGDLVKKGSLSALTQASHKCRSLLISGTEIHFPCPSILPFSCLLYHFHLVLCHESSANCLVNLLQPGKGSGTW